MNLNVGLLGITHPHASGRLKALARDPEVEVVAAADENEKLLRVFSDHFNLRQTTPAAMIDDPDIDAVLIHSKSDQMAPLAIAALEQGKHVLVEKTAGADLDDVKRLAQAASASPAVCQVGYNFRFSPAIARGQEVLRSGVLGDVIQARVHGGTSLGESATTHLNQPKDMGGALWVIGCHVVDLALMFFGTPNEVNARVPKFHGEHDRGYREDAAAAALSYPDKLVSIDFTSWDAQAWIESWEVTVYGTNGVLTVRPLPASMDLYIADASSTPWQAGWTNWRDTAFPQAWAAAPTDYSPEIAEVSNSDLFAAEVAAFLDAVRGRRDVAVSARDAFNTAAVIEACYRSSNDGGRSVNLGALANATV